MDNSYSDNFIRVELDTDGIKNYLAGIVNDIETKVLINLLVKYLQILDDKKIKACEMLLENLENYYEIKEACYCLAYGTNYITYMKKEINK